MSVLNECLLASVIVPVYNKEQYLDACFKTLNNQTLSKDRFEAIFIDDGSNDSSQEILKAFAATHSWVKVIKKENEGVCSARNAGIHAARGKYLFYLDPDDAWSENVLEGVCAFFDKHYDEVDLVTYPIVPYQDGKKQIRHFRYDILTTTGIYDLTEGDNWLTTQTTMNICVKNKFEFNHTFDFISGNGIIYHEDEQYIAEILLENSVIGYYAEAEYIWYKNENSVSSNNVNSYYLFDNTINMYEHLFSLCDEFVPRFLQSILVNDFAWKMAANAALPNHLEGEKYSAAMGRIRSLLQRVDDEVLLRHPNMHLYHRFFFLKLKWGDGVIRCAVGSGGLTLMRDDSVLYVESRIEINLMRTRTTKDGVFLVGIVKSPTFLFLDETIELYASHSSRGKVKTTKIELENSSWSRLGTRSVVANNYVFRYMVPFGDSCDLRFFMKIGEVEIPTRFSVLANRVNFSHSGSLMFTQRGHQVSLQPGLGCITVRKLSRKAEAVARRSFGDIKDFKINASRMALYIAQDSLRKSGRRIWIYGDAPGRFDNSWYQFEHDCILDDGVTRYYVTHGERPELPQGAIHSSIIQFGSRKHRFLYLLADKLLCSDIARACVMPWSDGRRKFYADFDNPELIYLQHGVLWAHMPWYYSYDRVLFDKEVVSTQFEIDNLTSRYGFRREDLISSGMPRYDMISHDVPAKKKILLCPSWRSYLIGELDNQGRRVPNIEKFVSSNYYRGIEALLRNERLNQVLCKYDYELVFKLHPNFACYEDCFESPSDRIIVTSNHIDENEFAIAITDYSSYSFDFVYLNRALIYYITDLEEFRAGINNYNKLDLPLDDALGEYARTDDDVINAIERILSNGGRPVDRFEKREKGFFLYYDNAQRKRLYNALLND